MDKFIYIIINNEHLRFETTPPIIHRNSDMKIPVSHELMKLVREHGEVSGWIKSASDGRTEAINNVLTHASGYYNFESLSRFAGKDMVICEEGSIGYLKQMFLMTMEGPIFVGRDEVKEFRTLTYDQARALILGDRMLTEIETSIIDNFEVEIVKW